MDDVPHIDWPIRLDGNGYATCQQDTAQEIAAAVAALFSFERGTRIESPDFGILDPTFAQQPVDTTDLEQQAGTYEPRAELTITVTSSAGGEQRVQVTVRPAGTPQGAT